MRSNLARQLVVGQLRELLTGHHEAAIEQPNLVGDGGRRQRVVAGDHHGRDARVPARPHRRARLGPRRIHHADEPEPGHLALGIVQPGVTLARDREHAQARRGELMLEREAGRPRSASVQRRVTTVAVP